MIANVTVEEIVYPAKGGLAQAEGPRGFLPGNPGGSSRTGDFHCAFMLDCCRAGEVA